MKKTLFLFIAALFLSSCTAESDAGQPQALGSSSASVLIEEFSDLQCPNCAIISPQIEEVVRENPKLAQLHFYHYPLSIHSFAFVAAEAAECAGDQGKFWEFIDLIFQNQSDLNEDFLRKVADTLKLNREDFDTCLEQRKYKTKVQTHLTEGQTRNIPGTPTIFVNGEQYQWVGKEGLMEEIKKRSN